MKLLLIEDNLELSHWLARLLREQDFVVDEVGDGAAADMQLRQARYDLVLLDLNIPQLSGKGVLRRLRERGDGVPVLILTASASLDQKVLCLEIGADDYMVKPIEGRELASYKLASYARGFSVSFQTLVNDDVGALADLSAKMSRGARAWFESFLVDTVIANPKLADGKAVFHADHSNLAATGTVPTNQDIAAARLPAAMPRQATPPRRAMRGRQRRLHPEPSLGPVPVVPPVAPARGLRLRHGVAMTGAHPPATCRGNPVATRWAKGQACSTPMAVRACRTLQQAMPRATRAGLARRGRNNSSVPMPTAPANGWNALNTLTSRPCSTSTGCRTNRCWPNGCAVRSAKSKYRFPAPRKG